MNGKNFINEYNIKFKEFELENGLKVILSENNNIPSFALNLSYHVGSKNEENGTKGFAHLFEHLMFTGSKNIKDGDYDRICNLAGGDNSAYTTEDKTSYMILLPSSQLEIALWLESDRMLEFSVTQDNLNTQRDIVLEEKSQNYDNRPYGSAVLELSKRLFNNCYGWTPIGIEEDIRNADLHTAEKFFNKYYTPANAVLSISGDIDSDETIILINKYFGNIENKSLLTFNYTDDKMNAPTNDIIYDNVHLPGIFIGYKIPGEKSEDFYSLNLLSNIIADGDSSRLYKKLIYDNNLAFEADCFTEGFEFSGIFSLYTLLQPGIKTEDAEQEINSILEDIKSGNINESDIKKSVNKTEARYFQRRQTNSAISDLLSHYYLLHKDANLINNIMDYYYSITREKIIEAANKYLNNNNKVTLNFLPKH